MKGWMWVGVSEVLQSEWKSADAWLDERPLTWSVLTGKEGGKGRGKED